MGKLCSIDSVELILVGEVMKKLLFVTIACLLLWSSISWAEFLSVRKEKVNVRAGPGTSHEILWQVYKNYPVKVLEKKGEWVKAEDYENDVGWIYRPLLSEVHTVIVIKDKINIRSGPGTNHEIAFQAEKDVIFQLLETKDNWLKVKHEDHVGWIHKDLVWGE
jgi:SH3-like domain-containing protein